MFTVIFRAEVNPLTLRVDSEERAKCGCLSDKTTSRIRGSAIDIS